MLKVILLTALASVAALPGRQVSAEECLSCGWITEEGTRALFKMNKQMEDSITNGGFTPLPGNPKADEMLMSIMQDVVDIMQTQNCNEILAGKLVAMLARLEEGDDPTQKNSVPYRERPLVNTLEQHFVRFLGVCIAQGQDVAKLARNNSTIQETWRNFVEFGEFLKRSVDEYSAAHRSIGSSWFTGMALLGEGELSDNNLGPAEYRSAIMKRAMQIMSFGYLYEKIRSSWGQFFGAHVAAGSSVCKQAIATNLKGRFRPLSLDLMTTFKPLLTLAGYRPDQFVNVPPEARKGRKIYEALEQAKAVMKEDKGLADLLALHLLMRKTLRRAEDYCPRI